MGAAAGRDSCFAAVDFSTPAPGFFGGVVFDDPDACDGLPDVVFFVAVGEKVVVFDSDVAGFRAVAVEVVVGAGVRAAAVIFGAVAEETGFLAAGVGAALTLLVVEAPTLGGPGAVGFGAAVAAFVPPGAAHRIPFVSPGAAGRDVVVLALVVAEAGLGAPAGREVAPVPALLVRDELAAPGAVFLTGADTDGLLAALEVVFGGALFMPLLAPAAALTVLTGFAAPAGLAVAVDDAFVDETAEFAVLGAAVLPDFIIPAASVEDADALTGFLPADVEEGMGLGIGGFFVSPTAADAVEFTDVIVFEDDGFGTVAGARGTVFLTAVTALLLFVLAETMLAVLTAVVEPAGVAFNFFSIPAAPVFLLTDVSSTPFFVPRFVTFSRAMTLLSVAFEAGDAPAAADATVAASLTATKAAPAAVATATAAVAVAAVSASVPSLRALSPKAASTPAMVADVIVSWVVPLPSSGAAATASRPDAEVAASPDASIFGPFGVVVLT